MIRCSLGLVAVALLILLLAEQPTPARPQQAQQSLVFKSPLGLVVDARGERAFVALHGAGTVAVVDLKAGKVLREIAVGKGPYDVALGKGTLYVTCEADDTLVSIDLAKQAVKRRITIGQSPRGLAIEKNSRLYIACHDASMLQWLEITTGRLHSLPLPPWPDRLAIVPTSRSLFALSGGAGAAQITLVKTGSTPTINGKKLLTGGSNWRGMALLPTSDRGGSFGRFVHQRPKTFLPTTQVAQGWVFTNAVSFMHYDLDERHPEITGISVVDDPNRGFADPSDIVMLAGGRQIVIACAGADVVQMLDVQKEDRYFMKQWWYKHLHGTKEEREASLHYPTEEDYLAAKDDLTASRQYITARLKTQANPRRLALSGNGKTLVVSNYLADSLTVIDVARKKVSRHISLGGPRPDATRRGEILFNSGKMTFHGQFTCASCHPNGGSDGLTWDLTRDGIGNFKRTKSLLGVKDTAPYGWHGTSPTLADRVAGTLRTLHRHEPTGTEVSDIVAYLKTLSPPRPLPVKTADKPAVARGRDLFQGKARCVNCHRGDTFQDGKLHDVGTRGAGDTQDAFDTPSLRGVARNAPYLHDGRARTLEEIFSKHNPKHEHGTGHKLSPQEMADVIAYLKSL